MNNITVLGAGTMGNGIAHVFAQNNFKVNLVDISSEALENAIKTISKNLDRMVAKEKISNDDRHLEIELLLKEYCNKRIFPGWNMKDDPARTWFWNKEEINSGIFNKIPRAKIIEVFEKIANQIN